MNEHMLNDPRLQSLEARLAAAAPQLPAAAQRELLYECGFAAGRKASRGALVRWRSAAAVLLVLAAGLSVAPPRGSGRLAEQESERPAPVEAAGAERPVEAEAGDFFEMRSGEPVAVALDAWQIPSSGRASLTDDLARLDGEPQQRSLTVGRLTRAILEP